MTVLQPYQKVREGKRQGSQTVKAKTASSWAHWASSSIPHQQLPTRGECLSNFAPFPLIRGCMSHHIKTEVFDTTQFTHPGLCLCHHDGWTMPTWTPNWSLPWTTRWLPIRSAFLWSGYSSDSNGNSHVFHPCFSITAGSAVHQTSRWSTATKVWSHSNLWDIHLPFVIFAYDILWDLYLLAFHPGVKNKRFHGWTSQQPENSAHFIDSSPPAMPSHTVSTRLWREELNSCQCVTNIYCGWILWVIFIRVKPAIYPVLVVEIGKTTTDKGFINIPNLAGRTTTKNDPGSYKEQNSQEMSRLLQEERLFSLCLCSSTPLRCFWLPSRLNDGACTSSPAAVGVHYPESKKLVDVWMIDVCLNGSKWWLDYHVW